MHKKEKRYKVKIPVYLLTFQFQTTFFLNPQAYSYAIIECNISVWILHFTGGQAVGKLRPEKKITATVKPN